MLQKRTNTLLVILLTLGLVVPITGCARIKKELKYKEASIAHKKGDYQKAIPIYKEIIAKDPKNQYCHYDLATAYIETKKFSLAIKHANTLKKLGHGALAESIEDEVERRKL